MLLPLRCHCRPHMKTCQTSRHLASRPPAARHHHAHTSPVIRAGGHPFLFTKIKYRGHRGHRGYWPAGVDAHWPAHGSPRSTCSAWVYTMQYTLDSVGLQAPSSWCAGLCSLFDGLLGPTKAPSGTSRPDVLVIAQVGPDGAKLVDVRRRPGLAQPALQGHHHRPPSKEAPS